MSSNLFPLPLTPFEYYYWCDDRPDYPTTFPIELVFRGSLDRRALEAALEVGLDRHPLLDARVDASSGKHPTWIPSDSGPLSLDWGDWDTPIDHTAGRCIDLTSHRGIRVWVRTASEQSRLVLQFHHACCDALGAQQFVADVLVAYDSAVEGKNMTSRLRPLDPQRLLMRNDFGLTEAGYRPTLRDSFATVRYWIGRLLVRPALLAVPPNVSLQPSDSVADLGYLTRTFTKADRDRWQARASQIGASVNDLLIGDLLVTLRNWNRTYGGDSRRMVVNVPVSLRSHSDQMLPAANVLGFWFLQRTPRACKNPWRLLEGIRDELEAVRRWRLPLYFMGGLAYAYRYPALIRRVLLSNKSFATIVLSNGGRVLARLPLNRQGRKWLCGGALLERITGVPPVRPGTRVSIIVSQYAHETCINLYWDPQTFDEAAAHLFLDQYIQRLSADSSQW